MTRIIVGLITLAALIEGLAPGAVPSNLLPLAIALLGLAYGWTAVDAEDPVAYLAVTIAVGAAAGALAAIPVIGGYIDAIVAQVSAALYAGVISILVARTVNRLKG